MRALSGTGVAILIAIVAVGTFALRAMFLEFHDRLTLPRWVKSSLVWVPAAVLAALIAPSFVPTTGGDPARLVAGAAAALVAWRTKNLFATLVVGMIVLWGVEAWVVSADGTRSPRSSGLLFSPAQRDSFQHRVIHDPVPAASLLLDHLMGLQPP